MKQFVLSKVPIVSVEDAENRLVQVDSLVVSGGILTLGFTFPIY